MTFKVFFEHGFGWITPKGVIYGCSFHNHLDALKNMEEVRDIEEIARFLDEEEATLNQCKRLAEAGEHPCMHHYDMISLEACEYVSALYRAGFVRLGISKATEEFCVEGTPQAIKALMPKIQHCRKEYNAWNRVNYTLDCTNRC